MSTKYDDAKYGVIERKWFGLPKTHGGGAAAGITFDESESLVEIKRWYPKGPVQALKVGVMTLATLGKGEQAFAFYKNTTRFATIVASTTSAPYTIASKALTGTIGPGSYLNLIASTNVCSTGTVALFMDYRRMYNSKHDATS